MTIALCFNCGATKWGAFNPCQGCGKTPANEADLAWSLAFSDHHLSIAQIEALSNDMRSGAPRPELPPATLQAMLPAAQEAIRMLGPILRNPHLSKQRHAAIQKSGRRRALRDMAVAWLIVAAIVVAASWGIYKLIILVSTQSASSKTQRSSLIVQPQNQSEQTAYIVDGEIKGFFCRFFGFVCSFKKVDALTGAGSDEIRPVPRWFPTVSDHKVSKDGTERCWVTSKADESRWGWWALLWDWYAGAPVFYASKPGGGFEELGRAEFVVFKCRRRTL